MIMFDELKTAIENVLHNQLPDGCSTNTVVINVNHLEELKNQYYLYFVEPNEDNPSEIESTI